MIKHYQPINCSLYDHLEAAITKNEMVELIISSKEGIEQKMHIRCKDLYAKNGEEFLVLENESTLRLDQILSLNGINFKGMDFCSF